MKKCSKCKEEKQFSEFHKKSVSKDGLRSSCKDCTNESNRKSFNKSDRKSKTEEIFREKESNSPPGYKYCRKCDEYKKIDLFYKHSKCNDGVRPHCIECHSKNGSLRYEEEYKNTEKLRVRARGEHLFRQFKITIDQYDKILISQNFCCAICKRHQSCFTKQFSVDHDHNCCTGKTSCGKCIRGLLCTGCNTGLGLLGDNKDSLQNAVEYLSNSHIVL